MSEQWRCPVCETMNPPDVQLCIVCGTPKAQEAPNQGDSRFRTDGNDGRIKFGNTDGKVGDPHAGTENIGGGAGVGSTGSMGTGAPGSMGTGSTGGMDTGAPGSMGTGSTGGMDHLDHTPDRSSKKKKIILAIGTAAAIIFIGLVYFLFFQKVNAYETHFDHLHVSLLNDSDKIDYYLGKAEKAINSGNYSEAEFYLRKKALDISDDNASVWAGILELNQRNSDMDQMIRDVQTIIARIDNPGSVITNAMDTSAAQLINEAAEALCLEIRDCSDSEVPEEITETFVSINGFCDTCIIYLQDNDTQGLLDAKRNLYLSVYEELQLHNDAYIAYGQEILQEAYAAFPDDETFTGYITTYYDTKIQEAIDSGNPEEAHNICDNLESIDAGLYASRKIEIYKLQFDEAMSDSDTDTAYEICASAEVIDASEAASWQEQADALTAKTDFMKKVKKLFDADDYNGLLSLISSDKTYKSTSIYLQDGKVVSSVNSGKAYMYSSRGVYYGSFDNGSRSGSGQQFIYIDSDSYQLFDGSWSGGYPNGKGTYIWWASDGTKATVTGNFTDGYDDGTMTISWYSKTISYNCTATYKADKGTLKNTTKDGDQYKYAIFYASNGSSSWWWTSSLEGHGVSGFRK